MKAVATGSPDARYLINAGRQGGSGCRAEDMVIVCPELAATKGNGFLWEEDVFHYLQDCILPSLFLWCQGPQLDGVAAITGFDKQDLDTLYLVQHGLQILQGQTVEFCFLFLAQTLFLCLFAAVFVKLVGYGI